MTEVLTFDSSYTILQKEELGILSSGSKFYVIFDFICGFELNLSL